MLEARICSGETLIGGAGESRGKAPWRDANTRWSESCGHTMRRRTAWKRPQLIRFLPATNSFTYVFLKFAAAPVASSLDSLEKLETAPCAACSLGQEQKKSVMVF